MNRDECKSHIQATWTEYAQAKQNRKPWQTMIGGLAQLAEQSSEEFQVLLELIQNAVDSRRIGQDGVEVKFILDSEQRQLIVTNDGRHFTQEDFDAITVANKSSKGKGKIGYKGIGFKSVARISQQAQIHSGFWHFEFNHNRALADGLQGAWLVIPYSIEDEYIPSFVQETLTTFVFPLSERVDLAKLQVALQDLPPELLLFLDNLRGIHIEIDQLLATCFIREPGTKELQITRNQETLSSWHVFRFPLVEPKGPEQEEQFQRVKEDYLKRRQLKELNVDDLSPGESEIVIAFQVDNGKLRPVDKAKLFAYFPIQHVTTGLRFLIQGDFLTTPSRNSLLPNSPWNYWVRHSVVAAIIKAVEQLAQDQDLCPTLYDLLPRPTESEWLTEIENSLFELLKQASIVLTDQHRRLLVKPIEAVWPERAILRDLIPARDLGNLHPGRRAYVSKRVLGRRAKNVLKDLGVIELTVEDLLRYLREYAAIWKTRPASWFKELYRYLSEIELTEEHLEILKQLPLIKPEQGNPMLPDDKVFWPEVDEQGDPVYLPSVRFVNKLVTQGKKVREFLVEKLGVKPGTRANLVQEIIIPNLQNRGQSQLDTRLYQIHLGLIKDFAEQDFDQDTEQHRVIRQKLRHYLLLKSQRGTWQSISRLHLSNPASGPPTLAQFFLTDAPDASELFLHNSYISDPTWKILLDWLNIPTEPKLDLLIEKLGLDSWLRKNPIEWYRELYTYLYRQHPSEEKLERLRKARIIMAQDGRAYRANEQIFLSSSWLDEETAKLFKSTDIVFVHAELVPSNVAIDIETEPQYQDAELFLRQLGIREVSFDGLLQRVIVPTFEEARRSDNYNQRKLLGYTRLVHRFYSQSSEEKQIKIINIFRPAVFLWDIEGEWRQPSELYLTQAYGGFDLEILLQGVRNVHFVKRTYLKKGDGRSRLWAEFMEKLGVKNKLETVTNAENLQFNTHPHGHLEYWDIYHQSYKELSQWGSVLRRESWRHTLRNSATIQFLDEILFQRDSGALTIFLQMLSENWDYYSKFQYATYYWYLNARRSKTVDTYWLYRLKTTQWLPTTKGLISPGEKRVYVKPTTSNELHELLGETVPYLPFDVRNSDLRSLFKIENKADPQDVVNYLEFLKQSGLASEEKCAKIFDYLHKAGKAELLRNKTLIYLPTERKTWWKPEDVFWGDYSKIFGYRRAYVIRYEAYQSLFHFFKATGASVGEPTPQEYIRLLQELANDKAAEHVSLWKAYLELERDFQATNGQISWGHLLLSLVILTEQGKFVRTAEVYLPDDPERHKLFADLLPFVWVQPGHNWREIENLLAKLLKLRSIKEYVKEEFILGEPIAAQDWQERFNQRVSDNIRYFKSLLAHKFSHLYRDQKFEPQLAVLHTLQPILITSIQVNYSLIDDPALKQSPAEQPEVVYLDEPVEHSEPHHRLYVTENAKEIWEAIGAGIASLFTPFERDIKSELMQLFAKNNDRERDRLFKTLHIPVLSEESTPEPVLEPPPVGFLSITSIPPDATIYLDGEQKGQTPVVLGELMANRRYIVRAELNNQMFEKECLLVPGQHHKISFEFSYKPPPSPTAVVLDVNSHPQGARISVNHRYSGETPLSIEMEINHNYIIEAFLFGQVKSRTISPTDGRLEPLTFQFAKPSRPLEPGTLVINSIPPGATIFMGNINYGEAPVVAADLRGKSRPKVTAILDGRQASQRFTVPAGGIEYVTIEIPQDGPEVEPAQLTVYSRPEGASIWIDGEYSGQAPVTVANLAGNQQHTIEAELAGQRERRAIWLVEGESEELLIEIQVKEKEPTNKQVERWAIEKYVIPYEEARGRRARDVSEEDRGYDVYSEGNGTIRYIEIKSSRGKDLNQVTFTENEWQIADETQDKYYLYLVTEVRPEPKPGSIEEHITEFQNPYEQFKNRVESRQRTEYVLFVG